jgi:hypothetical protein
MTSLSRTRSGEVPVQGDRVKKPQWGNAAWKAAMKQHEWKRGHQGMRMCSVTARSTGLQCRRLAMRGMACCHIHGGRGLKAAWKVQRAIHAKAIDQGRHIAGKFKKAGRTGEGVAS